MNPSSGRCARALRKDNVNLVKPTGAMPSCTALDWPPHRRFRPQGPSWLCNNLRNTEKRVTKTALITGAAGFVGSHLTDRCLQLGWDVVALDAFTDYYDPAIKRRNLAQAAGRSRCTLIEADLLEVDLRSILSDVMIVFHLAAQPGVRSSWDDFDLYLQRNVSATQRILHAARETSVDRIVIASSSSVYGDAETMPTTEMVALRPVSPYGITKVAVEHLAHLYWRSFRVPSVCLRYFTVYGPRQRPDMAFNRLISSALIGAPFEIFGDGNQTRDFTYVDDVISGSLAAAGLGEPGAVYNLGGGSTRTMNSVIAVLQELLDSPVQVRYIERQKGDARDTAADITRARRALGFQPAMDFESGLARQLAWHRSIMATETDIPSACSVNART